MEPYSQTQQPLTHPAPILSFIMTYFQSDQVLLTEKSLR